jgi:hypothetical protein
MAQRRMFSKEITNSSEFLMMSQSAQNLYFHFGMNADDDGFCEVFAIMRMTDSKPDDLQSLHARGFIYVADNKICIVKDWHENNQLRVDRYKQSKYLEDPKYKELYMTIMEDKIKEISLYSGLLGSGKPNGNQMVTQERIGKDRIVKNIDTPVSKKIDYLSNIPESDIKEFVERFDMSKKQLMGKAESLLLYCQSKNKRYANYRAFLLNAIKRDFKERPKVVEKPVEPELTPEQRLEVKKNLDLIRKKMSIS